MLNKFFYILATLLLLGCGTKVPFQKAKATISVIRDDFEEKKLSLNF